MPAEWEPHDACWLAYPYLEHEWPDQLEGARHELVELCRAIGESERVELLVPAGDTQLALEEALAGTRVRFHQVPYGDIWTRDTGPIFTERAGSLSAACFRFNGWGGKYVFDGDTELAVVIAELAGAQVERASFVLEGVPLR